MSIRNTVLSLVAAGALLAGCSTAGGTHELRAPSAGSSSSAARVLSSNTDNQCEPAPREPQYKALR
jgi:hypothetical protein